MLMRIGLTVVTLIAVAWLGIGLRDAVLQQRGLDMARDRAVLKDPRQAAHADSLLRRARFANPDPAPLLYRAGVAYGRGRLAHARGLLLELTRREPDDIDGWSLLASIATRTDDRGLRRRAVSELRRLSTPTS